MASAHLKHESKYDVFVSFRGTDIRDTFFSHLHAALEKQGIKVFKDMELERGEEISLGILKAIEQSKIALIIFSQNYASSSWCLDELVKIMECRVSFTQRVVPVFYRVDPEDVENQTGSYGQAMAKHEVEFKDSRKVQTWREALKDASYISGWDSNKTRPDAVLVEEIAKDIANKLKEEVPGSQIYGICVNCYSNSNNSNVSRNRQSRSQSQASTSNSLLATTLEESSVCSTRNRNSLSGSESSTGYALDEERKRKRMILNRESARRSRMRKRKALDNLLTEISNLRSQNNVLNQRIDVTLKKYNEIDSGNCVLRAQAVELVERLRSLYSVLDYSHLNIPDIPVTLINY